MGFGSNVFDGSVFNHDYLGNHMFGRNEDYDMYEQQQNVQGMEYEMEGEQNQNDLLYSTGLFF